MPDDRTNPSASSALSSTKDSVEADIGGVQGAPSDDAQEETGTGLLAGDEPDEVRAPDSGEIEWAGQVVKKPPAPGS